MAWSLRPSRLNGSLIWQSDCESTKPNPYLLEYRKDAYEAYKKELNALYVNYAKSK